MIVNCLFQLIKKIQIQMILIQLTYSLTFLVIPILLYEYKLYSTLYHKS